MAAFFHPFATDVGNRQIYLVLKAGQQLEIAGQSVHLITY